MKRRLKIISLFLLLSVILAGVYLPALAAMGFPLFWDWDPGYWGLVPMGIFLFGILTVQIYQN